MSLLITALSLLVLAFFLARAIRQPKGFRYPDHDSPRHRPEHGPPAGVHPMNVCAHGEEEP